jgi:hypothetical protein
VFLAVHVWSYSRGELEVFDELKKLGEWIRETVSQVTMVFRVRKLLQSHGLMKLVVPSCVHVSPLSMRG